MAVDDIHGASGKIWELVVRDYGYHIILDYYWEMRNPRRSTSFLSPRHWRNRAKAANVAGDVAPNDILTQWSVILSSEKRQDSYITHIYIHIYNMWLLYACRSRTSPFVVIGSHLATPSEAGVELVGVLEVEQLQGQGLPSDAEGGSGQAEGKVIGSFNSFIEHA